MTAKLSKSGIIEVDISHFQCSVQLFLCYQGRRVPLRFTLAPGYYMSRLRRFMLAPACYISRLRRFLLALPAIFRAFGASRLPRAFMFRAFGAS